MGDARESLLSSLMTDHRSIKCLVVDDNQDGASLVGDFLQLLGADVRIVYSGQEAMDIAMHYRPRMVVLDLCMPGIDGFETCRRLRQQQWSADAVFIAYTGLDSPKRAALAAGFDHVVSKGDPPDVFETILFGLSG